MLAKPLVNSWWRELHSFHSSSKKRLLRQNRWFSWDLVKWKNNQPPLTAAAKWRLKGKQVVLKIPPYFQLRPSMTIIVKTLKKLEKDPMQKGSIIVCVKMWRWLEKEKKVLSGGTNTAKKDAFQALFLPLFSFPKQSGTQEPIRLHTSPKRKMRWTAWSPALTTLHHPSTRAPGSAARCRCSCASSCSTWLLRRCQAAPRWCRRRLRSPQPGCWSPTETLEKKDSELKDSWAKHKQN